MVKQRGKATKPFDTNHTSASEARKSKPARRTEEGLRARKESDRLRVKTRINISYSFTRWRRFKEEKKLRTDADVANYLLNFYEKRSSILLTSTRTCMQEPSHFGCISASESFEEIEVTIDDDECNSVKSRLDLEHAPGAIDNCDEDIHVPIIPQSSTTSELLLECEEEDLEPWQKHTLLVHLKEEEEARELSDDQTDCKPDSSSLHTWLACQHLAFGVVPTFEVHKISKNAGFLSCVPSPKVHATSSNQLHSEASNS